MKVIKIENEKDIKKFLRRLFIYKSFLYRKAKFKLNDKTKNNDLQVIVDALNIKNRRKRIEYVYECACKKIDDFQIVRNVCGFKNGKCYVQRHSDKINGCCRKCIYISSSGCTTSNLTCKLFNCSEVCSRYKVIKYKDLLMLKLLTPSQRVIVKHDYFTHRKDALKDLYIGSVTIFCIRIVFRILFVTIDFKR